MLCKHQRLEHGELGARPADGLNYEDGEIGAVKLVPHIGEPVRNKQNLPILLYRPPLYKGLSGRVRASKYAATARN